MEFSKADDISRRSNISTDDYVLANDHREKLDKILIGATEENQVKCLNEVFGAENEDELHPPPQY